MAGRACLGCVVGDGRASRPSRSMLASPRRPSTRRPDAQLSFERPHRVRVACAFTWSPRDLAVDSPTGCSRAPVRRPPTAAPNSASGLGYSEVGPQAALRYRPRHGAGYFGAWFVKACRPAGGPVGIGPAVPQGRADRRGRKHGVPVVAQERRHGVLTLAPHSWHLSGSSAGVNGYEVRWGTSSNPAVLDRHGFRSRDSTFTLHRHGSGCADMGYCLFLARSRGRHCDLVDGLLQHGRLVGGARSRRVMACVGLCRLGNDHAALMAPDGFE